MIVRASAAIQRIRPRRAPLRTRAIRARRWRRARKRVGPVGFYGVLSVMLYYLLYRYGDDIRHMAEMTNTGETKMYFLAPIGIAFVFSIVHGLFTDRFWESVGLTAKR